MAKIILFISAIFLSFYGYAVAYTQKDAPAQMISLKRVGSEITEFNKITTVDGNGEFQFSVLTQSTDQKHFDVFYEYGGETKKITSNQTSYGRPFFFPGKGKFLELSSPGKHVFEIKFDKYQLLRTTILVEPKEYFFSPKQLNSQANSDKRDNQPVDLAYAPDLKDDSKFVHGIEFNEERGFASELYKKNAPSVPLILPREGLGSGIIIDKDGLILTNWHVIEGNETVKVIFKPNNFESVDNAQQYLADVIKTDQERDLALIKLRSFPSDISVIPLAEPEGIEVAMDVHAIGHPQGNFWTYTRGVISQIRPQHKWGLNDEIIHQADVLQTQTPINPGNSGGPLINDDGQLVGVNSFGQSDSQGLNFAVAVTSVSKFLKTEDKHKKAIVVENPILREPEERDFDGDGINETSLFDQNDNGIFELVERDVNNDGASDVILIDKNENEIFELVIYIKTLDGNQVAIWKFDRDENQEFEEIGYDFDMDGKVDKIEPA